jgi:hypothetical protein
MRRHLSGILSAAIVLTSLVLPAPGAAAATPPTVSVTNPATVFTTGHVPITVTTSAPAVQWTLADPQGLPIRTGTAAATAGRLTLALDDIGPGYYELTVTAATTDGSTTATGALAVMSPATADRRGSVFGAGTHVFETYKSAQLGVFDTVGLGLTRIDVSWRVVETTKGVYTFPAWLDTAVHSMIASGARPELVANYANPLYDGGRTPSSPAALAAFAEFANAVVEHYGPEAVDLAVWNEYTLNTDADCGDPAECYATMVRTVSERVKRDHPNTPVMASSAVVPTSGLASVDAVSAHVYGYPDPPEAFLAAGVGRVRSALDATPGGGDIPIWLDEFGWPTHDGGGTSPDQQADYLIRGEVLALAAGADRLYWYDLVNDGWDEGSRENQFGLLRLSRNGFTGLTPKPALAAQATVIRELGGRTLQGVDNLDADTRLARFTGDVRVLWSTAARSVTLAVPGPVTVTDRFGSRTTLTPVAGRVTLGLDGHPVFVDGAVRTATITTAPGVSFTVPDHLATGETGSGTVTVDCRHPAACAGLGNSVTVTVQGRTVTVLVHPGRTCSAAVSLTAPVRVGEYQATAAVAAGGRTVALLSASTTAVPATVITAAAELQSVDPATGTVRVSLTNNTRSAVPLGTVTWARGTETATLAAPASIPAGGTVTAALPSGPVDLWTDYRWTVTAQVAGAPVTAQGSTGFGPVRPAGTPVTTPIDLSTVGTFTYAARPWGGPADLSGTVVPSATGDAFVLDAAVTDDVFAQQNGAATLWRSDSIQFAISDGLPGSNLRESIEIGAALLPGGPAVYTFPPLNFGDGGPTAGATADITRDGTVTRYHVEVPWTSLGLTGPPVGTFGLSIAVNDDDNDGLGRAGFAEWGSGITGTKSSALFRPVQLWP